MKQVDGTGKVIIDRLRQNGLKVTRQRKLISEIFLEKSHVTVEELYREVRDRGPGISRITVYRLLKLLCRIGLARERHFQGRLTNFDNIARKEHHDHLICERCGRIVEFSSERIEAMQREIARRRGFVITRHRLEISGICRDCRR